MNTLARRAAIEWAQRIVANPDVYFLDTETLGKEKDSEICDIGIVGIDGVVYFDQLIRPSVPIPAEASEVHGITNEMVEHAPPWNIVDTAVGELLHDKHVVIYHANYDVQIINNANKRLGSDRIIAGDCAMLEFAKYMGVPGFRGQWKWHRLDVAAAHFNIPPGGHRALADAETARQVVLAMARSGVAPPAPTIHDEAVRVADGLFQQAFGRLPRREY